MITCVECGEIYNPNEPHGCNRVYEHMFPPGPAQRLADWETVTEVLRKDGLAQKRKRQPLATGVLDYFPDALIAVAETSFIGNEQHNPGQPLHWAKEKSTDHADCIMRHLIDRGTRDTDNVRHSAKLAWRALANLQIELERERDA